MLEEFLGLTVLTWLAFLVVVACIVVGIAIFDSISQSVWDPVTSVARWYALFIGFHVAHGILPLYVTHGQTRRAFAVRAAIFTLVFTAALAALMAIGYLVESWLVFLVWTATGLFLGAAFYRNEDAGGLAILPALIPVTASGLAFGAGWGPLTFVIRRLVDPGTPSAAVAIPIGVGCFLLALAMAWPIVRDIPIRSTSN